MAGGTLWFLMQWAYSAGYAVAGAGAVAYAAHVIRFVGAVVGAALGLLVRALGPPLPGPGRSRGRGRPLPPRPA